MLLSPTFIADSGSTHTILRDSDSIALDNVSRGPPNLYDPPSYGKKGGQVLTPPTDRPLTAAEIKSCQEVLGTLLYYGRAIDATLLPAINHIEAELIRPTLKQLDQIQRLLRYIATYPDNQLIFHRSNMQLLIHSDASFNSRSGGRSVVGGVAFLGTTSNGPTFTISKTLDVIVSSAAEAEYGAIFVNCKHAVNTRNILEALGHQQQPTQATSDNSVAVGLSHDSLKVKRSKAIDLRFHWIRDRIRQQQFEVIWAPGRDNLADFFTKPLPVHVHQGRMRQLVFVPPQRIRSANYRPPPCAA